MNNLFSTKNSLDMLMSRREFLLRSAIAALSVAAVPTGWAKGEALDRTERPKKVVVVGAGLAGLAAACQLTEAGHAVTVLEATTRPGGLVQTLRAPFSDGLYADAGAMFIPEDHELTMKYVNLFGLPLKPFFPQGLARVYYLRGKRLTVEEGQDADWPLALTLEEKELGLAGMRYEYVTSMLDELGDVTAADWPPSELKKYDRMSFKEFLRQQGASPAAIALLSLGAWGQWGEGIGTVSALLVLRSAVLRRYAIRFFRVEGGNDLLPRAFAGRLAQKIRYGAPVVRIEHGPQRVRVVFLQSGRRETLTADRVICAVPFSVLRHMELVPHFSPAKQRAVEQLPYSSATRVFLQSRRKFWVEQGLSGSALTDLPVSSLLEATANESGPRGILATYMSGSAARRFAAMPESQRTHAVLKQVERIFPGMRENFEGSVSISWNQNSWSRGAAPWLRPGQMASLLPHIARPEGRVHFAGGHTSVWMRWMQGALESGLRAAREVHEAA